MEPSAARALARETPAGAGRAAGGAGGGQAGEFFAALGDGWRLTAAQRARLGPVVADALSAGWAPERLAGFAGANTSGIRDPSAVLAARLSPAQLPPPPGQPARPPWCGECDEQTRILGFDSDTPRPCLRCKSVTVRRLARGLPCRQARWRSLPHLP